MKLKPAVLIVTLLLALVAFGCTFGGTMAVLTVTQPAAPGSTAQIGFTVNRGDSANDVADRLQQKGLIRNATLFKLLARAQSLDSNLRAGTYTLSPGMSMDGIIQQLSKAQPDPGMQIVVGPGLRILEYPAIFKQLHNFDAATFVKIAQTGKYPDGNDFAGQTVSQNYWFVPALHKDAKYVLEGYLYPDTYSFNTTDGAVEVINRMLDNFGTHLCPGPDSNPGEYSGDATKCQQHAAKVGTDQSTDIFTVAKAKYFTSDPVEALYKALTLSSIVIRESSSKNNNADAPQIADILYRRYLVSQGKLRIPAGGQVYDYHCLDADPTVWYAYYSDTPPTKGYWDVVGSPNNTVPQSPYNTYTHCTDLIPGPISAPYDKFLFDALDPKLGQLTPYFFYVHDSCLHPGFYTAITLAQQQINQARYLGKCPG